MHRRSRLLSARRLYRLHELLGGGRDPIEPSLRQGGRIDERSPGSQGTGSCTNEFANVAEADTAGGHQPHLGQRSVDGFEIARPRQLGRKDFDDVSSRFPGRQDFGGRERSRKAERAVATAGADHPATHGWRNDESGARQDRDPRCFGIEHGAGSQQDAVSQSIGASVLRSTTVASISGFSCSASSAQ